MEFDEKLAGLLARPNYLCAGGVSQRCIESLYATD